MLRRGWLLRDRGVSEDVLDSAGVPTARLKERVWVFGATQGQALGTSAQAVVVPADHAIPLPPSAGFAAGASLGVPALTAHRAVHSDGPVTGQTILVTGGAGAVGRYAVQFARLGGAQVIATASTTAKRDVARQAGAHHQVDISEPGAGKQIRELAPTGVDRIIDVAFGANLPLTSEVIAAHGTVAAYGSDAIPEPRVPFYPLMRRDVTLRFISVFAMPDDAQTATITDITHHLADETLTHATSAIHTLAEIARAHHEVEAGATGKVLLQLP